MALTDFNPKSSLLHLLKKQFSCCKKCKLCELRTNVVFGGGSYNADIMIIGEAPGETEDEKGIPFVGDAGKMLEENLLPEANLIRDNIFLTNTILCRPPDNRNPLFEEEIKKCWPRLAAQIYLIRPKLIICTGAVAAKTMIDDYKNPISQYVNQILDYSLEDFNCKLFVTYHPSYLLRKRSTLPIAKNHWQTIRKIISCL